VNRERWVERAELLGDRGTNRAAFLRGEVTEYTWVELGAGAVPGELTAAYLWSQVEVAEEIVAERLGLWRIYHELLQPAEDAGLLERPVLPDGRRHDAHIYHVLLPDRRERDRAIERLAAAGVQAAFHFVPLHSSPAGRRYGRASGTFSVTDDISERLVRLPIWPGLTEADVEHVADVLGVSSPPRAPALPGRARRPGRP
jgi:dTDP-4-amino-4,6-dideoxygalactose transaminase